MSRHKRPPTGGTTSGTGTTPTLTPVQLVNGAEVTLNGRTFRGQNPDKTYSMLVDAAAGYGRVELRQGDTWVNDGRQRSEFRDLAYLPYGQDVWFSYAIRWSGALPTGDYNIVSQFNQGPDANDTTPRHAAVLGVHLQGGKLSAEIRGDTHYSSTVDPAARTVWSSAAPPAGQWTHLVVRARLSKDTATGQMDIWRDGVLGYSGTELVNAYNDDQGPYFKFGQYRWPTSETCAIEFANVEVTHTGSLADRVTSPKPLP